MYRYFARALPLLLLAVFAAASALAAEGRTPVFLPGSVLAADGKYVLTRNLMGPGPLITICGANVDLDLNGMVITNTAGGDTITTSGCPSPVDQLAIRGGTIAGGDTGISVTGLTRNVDIEDVKLKGTGFNGAILLLDVEGVTIRRVEITDSAGEGILWGSVGSEHGTIEKNLIRRANGGITVNQGSSVAILNNRIEAGTGRGISLSNCNAALVAENTIEQRGSYGIYLEGMLGGKVYNNVIVNCRGGMFLMTVGTLVLENTVSTSVPAGTASAGIRVWGNRNVIEGNVLTDNPGGGLVFEPGLGPGNACGNTFGRNTARGNGGVGLPACGAAPPGQLAPDFCDAAAPGCGGAPNTSFGTNLMPGPPLG